MRSAIDLERCAIRIEIEIEASPEAVFDALTDPKELETWWGSPETYRTQNWKNELRVGGERSCVCIWTDGQETDVRGEYRVLDRPNCIEFTWETKRDNYARTLVRIEIRRLTKGALLVLNIPGSGQTVLPANATGKVGNGYLGGLRPTLHDHKNQLRL